MPIQWFPGHMMKTMRMMAENIKIVDLLFYVLDARAPKSSINPYFNEMVGDKPIVYLLNKSDLADASETAKWIMQLSECSSGAIAVDATKNRAVKDIVSLIRSLPMRKAERWAAKGLNYVPKAMVVGVPNCGKSTIINMMCGSGKTVTGDKAGVTRGKQWVRVEGVVDLLDTPGTLPKKFDDETIGRRLAYLGSIKDEIVDVSDLAFGLIRDLQDVAPNAIVERYRADSAVETLVVMEQIAKNRGFLMRGGAFDYERTANAVIDDFRKGRLGRITLEKAER